MADEKGKWVPVAQSAIRKGDRIRGEGTVTKDFDGEGRVFFDQRDVFERWVPAVPPLPTSPYTIIRVETPFDVKIDCVLRKDGTWWDIRGVAERNLKNIVAWELLAEPCDEHYGAKDLDRARDMAMRDQRREIASALRGAGRTEAAAWVERHFPTSPDIAEKSRCSASEEKK